MFTRVRVLLLPLLLILLVSGASLVSAHRDVSAEGIGIYPTTLSFPNATRGGEYFKTVGIINSDESDTLFTFEGAGPIGGWLSFVSPDDRTVALTQVRVPAESERQVLAHITVPDDAANGQYRSVARIVARADAAQGAGASVGLGADIQFDVNVTGDQVLDGLLVDVGVSNVEIGSPLRLRASVKNSGNVRFDPEVTVQVQDADQNVVAEKSFASEAPVYPNEVGELNYEVDLSDPSFAEGDYQVLVSAKAGSQSIGNKTTSFSILPEGTLTRQGELKNLTLSVSPRPGDVGKVNVSFVNTGQVDTLAKFVGELYQDNRLVDSVSSEELLVPVRQEETLELLFRVESAGAYRLSGKVNYQGKQTETRELMFTISEADSSGEDAGVNATPTVDSTVVPPDSNASASDIQYLDGPGDSASIWQRVSDSIQKGFLNSPAGYVVVGLAVAVLVLLILLASTQVSRRNRV